nr:retrotransposon-related protein [Tanacetum cinerariifolium]
MRRRQRCLYECGGVSLEKSNKNVIGLKNVIDLPVNKLLSSFSLLDLDDTYMKCAAYEFSYAFDVLFIRHYSAYCSSEFFILLMDEQATRLLLKEQTDALHAQIAALAADLQAAKLIQPHHGGGDQGSLLPRSMRLEVPKFNGTEPERFNLVGAAAEWFRWMSRNKLITSWEGFLESVRNRFGPCLKPTLQRELLVAKPTSLGEAFSLARVIEARLEDQSPISTSAKIHDIITVVQTNNPKPSQVSATSSNSGKPPLLHTLTESTTNTNTTPLAIKWISPEERQECLNKQLCFNCDSKWMRAHKCPGKFLLHMTEDDDNPSREMPTNSAYYLEDKVNFKGEENVTTEDKGGGRTKRVSVASAWHKDFVMR